MFYIANTQLLEIWLNCLLLICVNPIIGNMVTTAYAGVPLQGGFIELAIAFFILAILAAVVGLGGVAGISMRIAKIFILIFLVLAVISLLL